MLKNQKNTPVTTHFSHSEGVGQPNAPVAVMDSGVGGIGVLRELRKLLPSEELLYFGDSANAPYGARDADEVREHILAQATRLLGRAKALVLACNTATALAAAELRRRYPKTPIIGMEPALKPALAVCDHPRILVLATPITLRERKFVALQKKHANAAEILTLAAPALVELVERGEENSEKAQEYLRALLAPFLSPMPHAIVLGCTHFPFAQKAILRAVGKQIPLFDGAVGTARQVQKQLAAAHLLNPSPTRGAVTLTSSDSRMLPHYAHRLFFEDTE